MRRRGPYGENRELDHIAGSDGLPLVGHTFRYLSDPYAFSGAMRERYGEVYRASAFFLRYLVLASADGIEFAIRDADESFSSRLGWEPFLARLFPNALPTMDFEEHRHHRRIMQAVFRPSAMSSYADMINEVVDRDLATWVDAGTRKMYPSLKALTLRISAKAFLGLDVDRDIDFINKTFITVNGGLAPIVPYPFPGLALWRALRARQRLFDYFRPMIEPRKRAEGGDIFTRLCQATDESGAAFSEQQVLDHLVNILSAAHDTSTTSLTIAMYYLARHPEWQDRLREVSAAIGAGPVAFDQLDRLVEHEWVFREALRIYPPAPQLFRRAIRDCEFKGHVIPANTQVLVDVGWVHRSDEYWSDPMRFDPERFSEARAEHKGHKYQWVPFGGGAHLCIGLHFATMSARIILHQLLTRYRFELVDNDVAFRILPITQPKDGLRLRVTSVTSGPESTSRRADHDAAQGERASI